MAALNPGQFKGPLYHGTTFDVEGKDIVPARKLDNPNISVWGSMGHSGQKSRDHAFATESEDTAWEFASRAGEMKRAEANRAMNPDPNSVWTKLDAENGTKQPVLDVGRVRVHTVAPHPLMERGVYHAGHPDHLGGQSEDLKEWKAPAFRKTGTIDIMPGRQGTFPSLNWNQFRAKDSGYHSDMNHPTYVDMTEGHPPASGPSVKRGFLKGSWAHDQAHSKKTGVPPNPVPLVHPDQMDLFSGKTVEHHAENDESALGDYHRNNLFGRL